MEVSVESARLATLTGPGAVVLLIGIVAIFLLPRRLLVVAFICMACSMAIGQQIVISTHFTSLRLMIAAGWVRVLLRKENRLPGLNALDKTLLVWVGIGTVAYLFRLRSLDALVNRLGNAFDVIGLFFIFRFVVRDYADIRMAIRTIALMMPLLMLLMSVEKLTGLNQFSVFGGLAKYTSIREDHPSVLEHVLPRGVQFRAQGPFRHPILAGTFAATSIPLIAALWYGEKGKEKLLSVVGIFSSMSIVVLTSSSGPLLASGAAVLSIFLWGLRKSARTLWYLFLLGLIVLAANMKAPIWFLIDRVSNLVGGGGWHRSMLIDQAIRHFGEWWLAGTYHTAHWMPYALTVDPNKADITNHFLAQGVDGGVLTLLAFVLLVVILFRTLAAAVREDFSNLFEGRLVWAMWGCLLSHVVTFFSVSYFDQMNLFWFLLLACISFVRTRGFSARTPLAELSIRSLPIESRLPANSS